MRERAKPEERERTRGEGLSLSRSEIRKRANERLRLISRPRKVSFWFASDRTRGDFEERFSASAALFLSSFLSSLDSSLGIFSGVDISLSRKTNRALSLPLSSRSKKNRFQSSLRVYRRGETRLRFPIPRRSEAKQSRAHHPHPKATHVQQGAKVGNRHAHQKSPNVSRSVVTVRDGRERRGVGEVDQRSDENCRQGGRERGFA